MSDRVPNIHIVDFASIQHQSFEGQVLLLDVRTPAEYVEEHLAGAVNIPLDELDHRLDSLRGYNRIYIYCRTGKRSHTACETLADAGIQGCFNLSGGIVDWKENHLSTVVKPGIGLSIDRQVKLIAGVLILLGFFLSYIIHPAFIALTVFVGSGLTFAGASGICAMAIFLSRMPWNRTTVDHASQPLTALDIERMSDIHMAQQ